MSRYITTKPVAGISSKAIHFDANTTTVVDSLSECSPACNCMYCRLSQDSSIAFSGSAIPVKPDTTEYPSVPRTERFSDLPDGTEFYVAQTYAYGRRKLYQKTMEDGGAHNAVEVGNTNIGVRVTGLQLVVRK